MSGWVFSLSPPLWLRPRSSPWPSPCPLFGLSWPSVVSFFLCLVYGASVLIAPRPVCSGMGLPFFLVSPFPRTLGWLRFKLLFPFGGNNRRFASWGFREVCCFLVPPVYPTVVVIARGPAHVRTGTFVGLVGIVQVTMVGAGRCYRCV